MIGFDEYLELAQANDPLDRLRRTSARLVDDMGFAAVCVGYTAVGDVTQSPVYSQGYSAAADVYLRTRFVVENPHYRLLRDRKVLAPWDVPFSVSDVATRWARPAGYRNGVSLSIPDAHGREVGSIHVGTFTPQISDRQLSALSGMLQLATLALSQRAAQEAVGLTHRELAIVRLVVDGASNPEIAQELVVSRSTVATHIEHILRKFGVESRVGIAVAAVRRGLV